MKCLNYKYKEKIFFTLIGVLIFIVGCNTITRISDIKNHPREYLDMEVNITGKVVDSFSWVFISYFEMTDGTDTIKVITTKPLPKINEALSVKGTVIYYTFGKEELIAVREKDEES